MYIFDIVVVISELVDKRPPEDGRLWQKHVKDDRLKMSTLSITMDGVINPHI
jgi:hypothetical protein